MPAPQPQTTQPLQKQPVLSQNVATIHSMVPDHTQALRPEANPSLRLVGVDVSLVTASARSKEQLLRHETPLAQSATLPRTHSERPAFLWQAGGLNGAGLTVICSNGSRHHLSPPEAS